MTGVQTCALPIYAATYQNPHLMSEGMQYAIVNGIVMIDAGTFTGKLPGRIVVPQRF